MSENNGDIVGKNTPEGVCVPRQDLVNTAVKFLQNPNVQRSSLKQQQDFLKSKGLTEDEINIACERSAALIAERYKQLNTNSPAPVPLPPAYYALPEQSFLSRFRDVANTLVFLGGVSYGLYILYKKYIVPWLFGEEDKRKPGTDLQHEKALLASIAEAKISVDSALITAIQDLRENLLKIQADLKQLKDKQHPSSENASAKQLDDLKAEVASVKGLLLNRNQFAPPIVKSVLTPTSIPTWQLESGGDETKDTEEGPSKGDADIEEICTSGSGSSETEMVTNNGSDSSLEMIRE